MKSECTAATTETIAQEIVEMYLSSNSCPCATNPVFPETTQFEQCDVIQWDILIKDDFACRDSECEQVFQEDLDVQNPIRSRRSKSLYSPLPLTSKTNSFWINNKVGTCTKKRIRNFFSLRENSTSPDLKLDQKLSRTRKAKSVTFSSTPKRLSRKKRSSSAKTNECSFQTRKVCNCPTKRSSN